jgi:hypothetical protein
MMELLWEYFLFILTLSTAHVHIYIQSMDLPLLEYKKYACRGSVWVGGLPSRRLHRSQWRL